MSTPRTGVGFGGPPPPDPGRRSTYDWETISQSLRRKPGEWYMVFQRDRHSIATSIRNGSVAALRPVVKRKHGVTTGFEVRTGNTIPESDTEPRMCSLWLRYVPDQGKKRK